MNFKIAKLKEKLLEKLNETLKAVLPIIAIVLMLCFTIAPLEPGILLAFLLGAVFLIAGMMFFTLGAEMSMTPIGENVGTSMTQTRKLWLMTALTFILGFIVTISEPDLQVLAEQVPAVPNMVLVLSVAFGVGIFLVASLLRMLYNISLAHMLIVLYIIVFILAFLAPDEFVAVAFDSGGVTTGPMTVPFIMAFGIGISAIRSDERAEDDSFGLVALSSVGPILSVLVLSLIYRPDSASYVPESIPDIGNSVELWGIFAEGLPEYMREMAVSLLPIIAFFIIFQIVFRRVQKRMLIRIAVGMVYTYAGLFLFLTGVNVGFMPAGNYLGQVLADNHRILYCTCRACGVRPDTPGRGYHFGDHKCGSYGPESLHWCSGISGTRYGAGADRNIDLLVRDTGICHCTAFVVLRTKDLYSYCF